MLTDLQIETPLISVYQDGRMNPAVIEAAEFDGEFLRIHLRDGRLIFIPESWFSALSDANSDQRSHLEISSDGSTLFWPELAAQLTTREILAGSEPCEGCWYRVAFFQ